MLSPRMRNLGKVAVALLALAACEKGAGGPAAAVPGPAASARPPSSAPEPPASPTGLTAERLQAFVKYQQRMVDVFAQAQRDVRELDARADAGAYVGDGGALAMAGDAVASMTRKRQAEAAARDQAGLTEAEVDAFEALVGDVVLKRQIAKTLNLEATLKSLERLRATLPKDQQSGVDPSLAELRKEHAELADLSEERRKYGAGSVDLVLSQEAELVRNHEKLMAVWSAKP